MGRSITIGTGVRWKGGEGWNGTIQGDDYGGKKRTINILLNTSIDLHTFLHSGLAAAVAAARRRYPARPSMVDAPWSCWPLDVAGRSLGDFGIGYARAAIKNGHEGKNTSRDMTEEVDSLGESEGEKIFIFKGV